MRLIDPKWRSAPGLYSTIEGATAHQGAVIREASAHLRRIRRPGIGDNGGPPLDRPEVRDTIYDILAPGGRAVGKQVKSAGPRTQTILPGIHDDLVLRLTRIGTETSAPGNYHGVWHDVGNACVIGVRLSDPMV